MAVRLHTKGFEHALQLIASDEIETFDADWSEEKPTPDEVNKFINTHYMQEYGLWFLGVDDKFSSETKEHYLYPHGDLKEVQRCALVDTLEKAQQQGHADIAKAAQQLLDAIDARNS